MHTTDARNPDHDVMRTAQFLPRQFLVAAIALSMAASASFADGYDVGIQAIHSRGLLHAEYDNTKCSATRITLNVPPLSTESQIFIYHTPTVGDAGVFDFRRDSWKFSGNTVTFNPWRRHTDGGADCAGGHIPTVTGNYALYKSFYFPEDIPADSGATKLIVLVHGWNPYELQNPYEGYGWPAIVTKLNAWVNTHPDWKLLMYTWAEDAATGPVLELAGSDPLMNAIRNGTQAAEIAHLHGLHLGPLIGAKLPKLEKIHFIAHSAGTWCARAAAVYLSRHSDDIGVQLTLLDPYIPGEAPDKDSACTIERINELASLDHVDLLENYYYENDVPGTQAVFAWREGDIEKRLGATVIPNPFNHFAPSTWYGGTIGEDATDGWSHSLAFREAARDSSSNTGRSFPGSIEGSEAR